MTEDATDAQIATLLRILKQMSTEIPNDLAKFAEATIKGREQDKQNKLCSHLKAFGKCMYVKDLLSHKKETLGVVTLSLSGTRTGHMKAIEIPLKYTTI